MCPSDSALGIFRSPDLNLYIPGRRILHPREPSGSQNERTATMQLHGKSEAEKTSEPEDTKAL